MSDSKTTTVPDPPPIRAIAELAEHAARVVDPEMTVALEEVEQWLSGFDLEGKEEVEPDGPGPLSVEGAAERASEGAAALQAELAALDPSTKGLESALAAFSDALPEPEVEEVAGPVEQEVLETLCGGGTSGVADDVIDAVSIVARAVDELTKRLDGGAR